MSGKIFDVFQPGLKRGAERLPYDPEKRYFYVEHPTEGWRVFLRAACFIHEEGHPFNAAKFLVVKKTGKEPTGKWWEPPKGQMEGKDGLRNPKQSLVSIMIENVRREVGEEAKVYKLEKIKHTGEVFQAVEPDFRPNTYFQYHIFQAFASPKTIETAFEEFDWIHQHPKAFARMRRDVVEKDDMAWFNPRRTRMMGRWSPSIVTQYLTAMRN